MDLMWHHAGCKSTDMNWYTKRLSLLAIYKSSTAPLLFIYYNKTHNELTHPRETRKRKSRDTVGTMSRDFTLCPGGDLNPHVLANTGT